jgi:hypothetical protein
MCVTEANLLKHVCENCQMHVNLIVHFGFNDFGLSKRSQLGLEFGSTVLDNNFC